ncbi:pseudouridine synthase [Sphingobacterium sp. lm-10]|uniref:pseudouridine synthase n=1 Tax=Sphingobacterium sp. lm-10 TaxID=2944904 RepID=UPI00201FDC51|nr:pseudouridine synthase [Sphingobacterium sp. lm-10]MCL7986319.1 pseudouridine synthase [Sphingobacterium sp. lm-10]
MPFNNKRNSRDDSARRGRNNEDSRSRSNDRPKSNFSSSDKRFKGEDSRSRNSNDGFAKKSFGDREDRKPYNSDNRRSSEDRKPYNSDNRRSSEDRKPYNSDNRRSSEDRKPYNSDNRRSSEDRKPYNSDNRRSSEDRKPYNSDNRRSSEDRKPYNSDNRRSSEDRKPYSSDNRRSSEDRKPYNSDNRRSSEDRKPYNSDNRRSSEDRGGSSRSNDKFGKKDGFNRSSSPRPDFKQRDGFKKRSFSDRDDQSKGGDRTNFRTRKTFGSGEGDGEQKTFFPNRKFAQAKNPASGQAKDDGTIRLNRYISNSGICSRRKADELIEQGLISVNGEVVIELGTKVDPAKDEIRYNNERLKREKMVYVLLNKPKDYITTTDDPQERRTVMQLVSKATKERIYPVGRLDRNTTGLLLLTNDGNLAEKLSHPRNNISKMYHVELDKSLSQGDMNKIQFGIELEDGLIKPDEVSYVTGASKKEVGIQIHSGKNRIVRRIFEHLGYEVVKLDRVVYANLTKKDLPRGRWRYLEERELIQLKHLMK